MDKRGDIISGVWKINKNVGYEKVVEFCEELTLNNPHYLQVFVRQTGPNNIGIFFLYKSNMKVESIEKQFLDEMVPKLRKVWGDDLTGWDVSAPTYFVKGITLS